MLRHHTHPIWRGFAVGKTLFLSHQTFSKYFSWMAKLPAKRARKVTKFNLLPKFGDFRLISRSGSNWFRKCTGLENWGRSPPSQKHVPQYLWWSKFRRKIGTLIKDWNLCGVHFMTIIQRRWNSKENLSNFVLKPERNCKSTYLVWIDHYLLSILSQVLSIAGNAC